MHPRSDVDRLYLKRAEEGRRRKSIEEVVQLEKTNLAYYLEQTEEVLLKDVVRDGILTESVEPKRKKQDVMKKWKAKFEEKKLHSVFFKEKKRLGVKRIAGCGYRKGY